AKGERRAGPRWQDRAAVAQRAARERSSSGSAFDAPAESLHDTGPRGDLEVEVEREAIARIERAIESLASEVAQLREGTDALRGSDAWLRAHEIRAFLDEYRAAESLGEAAFGAWIATCKVECLRGGLRTAQMRDGSHARLLEARLKELGGSPRTEVPES